jgi:hypothetical protein
MSKLRTGRLAAVAATGLLAASLSAVIGVSPAHASAASCEGGANGFVDISDSRTGTVVKSVDLGYGVTAQLHSGAVNGVASGWAKITGATTSSDRIWMDWTQDNGAHWLQCGPFSVGSAGTKTSASKRTSTSSAYRFRACGDLPSVGVTAKCTGWW